MRYILKLVNRFEIFKDYHENEKDNKNEDNDKIDNGLFAQVSLQL